MIALTELPVRIYRPVLKVLGGGSQVSSLLTRCLPIGSWILDKFGVVVEILTRPIQQADLIRETPVEHLFQALSTGAVLQMRSRRVPVVGDPIDKAIRVPSTDEGLTRDVELVQAGQDLEVTGKLASRLGYQ